TTSPFLNTKAVGRLRTPYLAANCWLASTSTLPTTALPSYSWLTSSMMGPTILQGPHQAAQKSTNTGLSLFKTSSSNVASVISSAISIVFCYRYAKLVNYCASSLRAGHTFWLLDHWQSLWSIQLVVVVIGLEPFQEFTADLYLLFAAGEFQFYLLVHLIDHKVECVFPLVGAQGVLQVADPRLLQSVDVQFDGEFLGVGFHNILQLLEI